jgi:hypothetical protein
MKLRYAILLLAAHLHAQVSIGTAVKIGGNGSGNVSTSTANTYISGLQDFSAVTLKIPAGFASGDCTATALGVFTCTKSNGTAFGTGAFVTISNYLTTATAASTYAPIFMLTTTGSSGPATYTGNVLNIPQYAAGTCSNAITINNLGSGAASGATFNCSAAVTISYNTLGAAPALACATVSTLSPANNGCYNLSTSSSVAMPSAGAFTLFAVNTESGVTATFTGTTLASDAGCSSYLSGTTLAVTGNQRVTVQSDGTNIWATCTVTSSGSGVSSVTIAGTSSQVTATGTCTITTTGTCTLSLPNSIAIGVSGTTNGTLDLESSTATGGITLTPAAAASQFTVTVPAATDTLVNVAGTQTLSNKTFVAPVLGAATATSVSTGAISGTGTATFAAGAALGSGGSFVAPACATGVTCDSVAGTITTTTGTGTGPGTAITVTLGGVTRSKTPTCMTQALNASTGANIAVNQSITSSSTTVLAIVYEATLATNTQFDFNYICFGQ